MREHEFATLFSSEGPWITHLPLILDEDGTCLRGHMARANGHAARLDGEDATAVFHGPHAYVSPSWYEEDPAVPTWNYAVVHASGPTRHLDPYESVAHLDEVLLRYEGGGKRTLPESWLHDKVRGIVAFELKIERLDIKLKMSQNKSDGDRARVVERLQDRAHGDDASVAEWVLGSRKDG